VPGKSTYNQLGHRGEERVALVKISVPVGAEDQQRCRPPTTRHRGDQVKSWPVSPVQIIEDQHKWTIARRGQRIE
jgi:hypothetical protein